VLLIEADGKALFREHGIPVPEGVVVTDLVPDLQGDGPWVVKAQVLVGGRGKVGGVVRCHSHAEVEAAVAAMLGRRLKGHTIDACLVEQAAAWHERYIAIMVDAAIYGLRVILFRSGRRRNRARRAGGSAFVPIRAQWPTRWQT
jgi:succinyl-CoA synthetase beta subunit